MSFRFDWQGFVSQLFSPISDLHYIVGFTAGAIVKFTWGRLSGGKQYLIAGIGFMALFLVPFILLGAILNDYFLSLGVYAYGFPVLFGLMFYVLTVQKFQVQTFHSKASLERRQKENLQSLR